MGRKKWGDAGEAGPATMTSRALKMARLDALKCWTAACKAWGSEGWDESSAMSWSKLMWPTKWFKEWREMSNVGAKKLILGL